MDGLGRYPGVQEEGPILVKRTGNPGSCDREANFAIVNGIEIDGCLGSSGGGGQSGQSRQKQDKSRAELRRGPWRCKEVRQGRLDADSIAILRLAGWLLCCSWGREGCEMRRDQTQTATFRCASSRSLRQTDGSSGGTGPK
jgi:hypothetical protein